MLIPARCNYTIDPSFTLLDMLIIPCLALPYLLTSLIPLISTFHGKIPFYEELVAYLARVTPRVRKDAENAELREKDAEIRSSKSARDAAIPNDARVLRMDAKLRSACARAMRSQFAKKTLWRVLDKCEEWHDYLYPFHFINRYAKFGMDCF